MFESLKSVYTNIVNEIGIVGYLEEDIIKRGYDTESNLPLNLLFSYPNLESNDLGNLVFQMMFPDEDHKIQTPKFFTLTLTNEQGNRSFLYCLKFPEKYVFNDDENEKEKEKENENKSDNNNNENIEKRKHVEVPLVIYIKSQKEDLESFKQLLYSINQIIVNDSLEKQGYEANFINNYKKIQLMNVMYFLFCLPHTSPHSLVKLQLNKELDYILNLNMGNKKDETIDFYFSSNCEIPCNKNDTDINILFLILDQSIIIKVLFSILTEKQIIFTASQAYLLHIIISTFLKLIFPFKWRSSCITVVPKENLEVLEIPGSYIFGVLSSTLSTKDLTDEYPGKIIVDCDTNEIFGYSNLEPFEPPKIINNSENKDGDKKKKDKDKKKDKELIINNLDTDNFAQGKNLIIVDKNVLWKYIHEVHGKKQKLAFDSDNNIIIDTQSSQLFIDKNDIFIDSNEWKWLRRNIQLVRNPEIFNLDNFDMASNKKVNKYFSNEEDNPILPNRPFSYNIQNIFLTFILKKLTYTESDFVYVFKKTNLFLEYDDTSKTFENTKGKVIIQNIEETKSQPRSIENSFKIEYILNPFNVQIIVDKIDTKINNNEKDENLVSSLKGLKKILLDYFKMKEELSNPNNDSESLYYMSARKPSMSDFRKTGGSNMKSSKISKNLFGHVKNNTSVLQETCGQNKYILLGIDKDVKDTFQFYSKNGFIYFLSEFGKFLKEEKIDLEKIIYNDVTNKQILSLINKCFNKKEKSEEKTNEDNKDLDDIDKQKLRKELGVSIVPEKKEEENNENEPEGRESQGSVKIKEEEYDFTENLMKGIKKEIVVPKIEGLYDLEINEENSIINFPTFDFEKERKKTKNKINKENGINQLMQYYLFLAFYLEGIKNDESSLNYFIQNFDMKMLKNLKEKDEKDNNENETKNSEEKLNINELIIRFYKLAYKCSEKKHRDYPYYSYYHFIMGIDSDELKSFNDLFDLFEEEDELGDIYRTAIIQKEQIKSKKVAKMETMSFRNNTSSNIIRTNTNYNKQINNTISSIDLRKSNVDIVKNKVSSSKLNNIFSNLHKRNSLQTNKILLEENINGDDFNIYACYIINSIKEFDTPKEGEIPLSIIYEIGELLMKDFPNDNDLKTKNVSDIIEETHNKVKENKPLIKMVGQLRYLKIEKINTKDKCMAFWLNCFNYLLLFAIFYKKWNIDGEKIWKKFFKNVKFDIGGKNYSFNDIQYIIFKKPSFISSSYKAPDEIKNLNIDKINGDKKFDDYEKLIPFVLYLPLKNFLYPSLFTFDNIEKQVKERINKYINKLVWFDDKNHLCCSELLLKYESNIFGRGIKKYESYFNPVVYNKIKDKKYKKLNNQKIMWKLNFDSLIEN